MHKLIRFFSVARDAIRRNLAVWLFDQPLAGGTTESIKRILVVRWDAKYGDSFVSSFFFREVKKHLPNVSIEVVIPKHMKELYLHCFHVDKVYFSGKRPSFSDINKLVKQIGDVDLVIHLPEALKPRDMYFIKQLKPRFFAGQDDALLACNIKLGGRTANKHFSKKFVAILEELGVSPGLVDTHYIVPQAKVQPLHPRKWSEGKRIVLNPFGNSQRRCLSLETIKKIVKLIKKLSPYAEVGLLSAPGKNKLLEQWSIKLGDSVVPLLAESDIQVLIEDLRSADIIISVDTAVVHIATGLQKPLLAIYSADAKNYAQWRPNSSLAAVVFSNSEEDINEFNFQELETGFKRLIK